MVLDALPEVGDCLDFVETALLGLNDDELVDNEKRRYVKLMDVRRVPGHARVVQADFEVGRFGETGGSRRVHDHERTHDHGPDEANVVTLRLVFVVPNDSRLGLMFAERLHPFSAATAVLDYLQRVWSERKWQKRLAFRTDSVVYPEAWEQGATATSFSAVARGHTADFEGVPQGDGGAIGNLTMTFVPENQRMSARVLAALRNAQGHERARILGISDLTDELDAVKAELVGEGGVTKTVNIDEIRPPSMSWDLHGNDADPAHPNYLITRILQECPEIYDRNGMGWHPL